MTLTKNMEGNWNILSRIVIPAFEQLKRNQTAITFHDGQYVKVTVSSINSNTPAAIDGPVVRVSNTEASWRVDGDHYAFPIKA